MPDWGGPVSTVMRVRTDGWAPPGLDIFTASTGDQLAVLGLEHVEPIEQYGIGRAWNDPDQARLVALGETLERYASLCYDDRDLIFASAVELGSAAMELEKVAQCSDRERAHQHCPVTVASQAAPIRWVEGRDLLSGDRRFVPAVMVYLVAHRQESERFWLPISTGCAAHRGIEAALVNAICEVIERDALAVTWLQKLPLPPLAAECVTAPATTIMRWCADRGVQTHLFDATSELGVPTVYALQTCDQTERGAQLIACATGFDVGQTATRAVTECMGIRMGVHLPQTAPRRYAEYSSVLAGAARMGARSARRAFLFLLDGLERREPSRPASIDLVDPVEQLQHLLATLRRHGMSAYGVDLSTSDLEDFGFVAVRVVIPELQPMSLRPLAQYRAHPRLYSAPGKQGFRALPESRLNPWPQPMA